MSELVIQIAVCHPCIPKKNEMRSWVKETLKGRVKHYEITLRIVDEAEITQLNLSYRGKNKPTNVLSFPLSQDPLVGDIIICANVVQQEAAMYQKSIALHWAHMVVHGLFHLLGLDHVHASEATIMQALEVQVLNQLGFDNPYIDDVVSERVKE